jgi:hypothetical protein
VDGMVKAVMDGLVVSAVTTATQVLPLVWYPELHDERVQVPYEDQVPELQVLDCEPVPLVMVHVWDVEPEQVAGGITTQVLPDVWYPELHDESVQVPYVDQVPELQVRDCEPVPLVIVQEEVVEPEQVTGGITTQVLLLAWYPELHDERVQVPYVDQVPELQVRDCEPVPFVMVQEEAVEPEQVAGGVTGVVVPLYPTFTENESRLPESQKVLFQLQFSYVLPHILT